jgi:chromosomal replication initiation ATPase DnaA
LSGPVPAAADRQLPFDYGHEPSHLEADFIEGEGNSLALAHVRSFPRWAAPLTLIEGPAKSGKSHLARIWAARAEPYVAHPEALGSREVTEGTRPLLVEDIDRAGYAEGPLFHLLNRSIRDGRPVLMTAREPVHFWPFSTDDLKSRARLAALFTMSLTDDIQLSQMLVKLFGDRQVVVEPSVVRYLVARMIRSSEEAVALVEAADRLSLSQGRAITRSIAALALKERGFLEDAAETGGNGDE